MEYPFKDLMPLDEVLAREGYYKDWTHLNPEVFYSLTQISNFIKTKGYGVDVRLLIAQLAEHFGLKTTQVVDLANLLQQKFTNLEGVTQSFTNNINSLVAQMEADKDAVIANVTVDSEVILARGGKTTLGSRLDEADAQLALTDKEVADNKKALLYVTPEMFGYVKNTINDDAIQEWLDYSKTNNVLAKAGNLRIGRNFSFRDTEIEITGTLNIGVYDIELGGSVSTWSQKKQFINSIAQTGVGPDNNQVYIRGTSNQEIEIRSANGVNFRLNDTDDKIAYCTFRFGRVYYLDIDNDNFNVSGEELLWFNENVFYLSITYHIRMDGTYWHNNNRFYGGTLEGQVNKIELLTGRDNAFYDMRFENVSTEPSIFFGDNTSNNTIYQTYTSTHPSRRVITNGKGLGNKIIIPTYDYSTKIIDELATPKNLDVFKNYGAYLKVDLENEHLLSLNASSPIFDTGLLPFKSSYAIHVIAENRISGGVRMKYQIYDENFTEILESEELGRMDGFGLMKRNQLGPGINEASSFQFNMVGISPPNVKYISFRIQTGATELSCSNIRVIIRDLNSSI